MKGGKPTDQAVPMTDRKSPDTWPSFSQSETSSAVRPLALPDVIDGRYRVLGRLGAGAMGIVLRAEDLFLERPVAVKIVEPSLDPAVGQRFMKEAQALAQLRHENIVQVYAFGPFQSSAYLAMELVVGESLESLIDTHAQQGATLALPRAIAIRPRDRQGLEAVHARRLVHRDVKPANVIIEKGTDRPVLIDFGLARRRTQVEAEALDHRRHAVVHGAGASRDPEGTRVTAAHRSLRVRLYGLRAIHWAPCLRRDRHLHGPPRAHNEEPRRISSVRPDLAPIDDVLLRARSPKILGPLASVSDDRGARAGIARSGQHADTRAERRHRSRRRSGFAARSRATCRARCERMAMSAQCDTAIESSSSSSTSSIANATTWSSLTRSRAAGHLGEHCPPRARTASAGTIVVISRDLPATTRSLGEGRVRHLVPKPVNVTSSPPSSAASTSSSNRALQRPLTSARREGGGPLRVFDHRPCGAEVASQLFGGWTMPRIATERRHRDLGDRPDLGICDELLHRRRESRRARDAS